MKIWLDMILLSQDPTNEYGSDCPSDCANDGCPTDGSSNNYSNYSSKATAVLNQASLVRSDSVSGAPSALLLSEEDSYNFSKHIFICSEALYTQAFGELWLVCTPKGAGKIAVLDAEAYTLLQCFRTAKMLQDVVMDSSMSLSNAERAVALLIRVGFLLDLDQPAPVPRQEEAQILSAWLHVTNACNLGCHYCYVSKSSEHMADDTSMQAVDAIIRSAMIYHHKGIHLTYAGGEATLRLPQVLATHDYAVQQAQAHGLSLAASLLSNGVAMPPRSIEQLKQRQIGVGLSLDGIGESHDQQRPLINGKGSFTFIDRTITRLLAGGLIPSINVTVTQRNLDDLPRLLAYILERDLPFGLSYYRDNECSTHLSDLQFTDANMISGMSNAFDYIEQHLPRRPLLGLLVDKANTRTPHQYKCGVGRNYLAIDQRGGIARCQADITDTVTSIHEHNPLRVIREHRGGVQAVAIDEKEGCRTCEWRYWCSGGCPMLTYRLTGRSDIKSPNCAIYKALFPKALHLEAQRLLKYEMPIIL